MKSMPAPYRPQLRILAGKLASESLTPDELELLVKFLCALAEGETVEALLGVKNKPHRPTGWALEQRIFDVAVLMLPKKHGGGGLKRDVAIAEIANESNKGFETVFKDYKSDRGKRMRAMVKDNYFNPLELD
jgi:hypothetical protein